MKYISVLAKMIFVFILAAFNLNLVQSLFIKQIISAAAPNPQNNYGSNGSGSATLVETMMIFVPLFTIKDLFLSCKASRRALLPRPLQTDVRMRLIVLQ